MFNIDINNDKTKAIIIIVIFFLLALYNFFSIPEDVLNRMKDRLNRKTKIYHDQNRIIDGVDSNIENDQISYQKIADNQTGQQMGQPKDQQKGGFIYLDQIPENRMGPWDQLPNEWDPIRLHDIYNAEKNPIVYQGFGIPLMSDLMCSSFAGLGPEVPNKDDRSITKEYDRNVLGTIPSDKESMFYFSDNISLPECCPGPYSSDKGCVCSFEKASFYNKNPIKGSKGLP